MNFISDLHLHSRFSRAVSQNMNLHTMGKFAREKGLQILTASDFTHPVWLKEIKANLEEAQEGLYTLKGTKETEETKGPLFLLSTEISSIYKEGEKLRRIHNLVFAPNLEIVEKINEALLKRGCNLNADGRPIIGLSSRALLELILDIDERNFLIPCHIWTPHFGIYGSASGYNSLREAFGDLDRYIYGIETGLSSDPEMNWAIEELKNRSILSFSDAHSPAKMGREATVFELETPSFENIKKAIQRLSNTSKIVYTIEFYPEEGKYHFSGHRNCKVVRDPVTLKQEGNICPVCKRKLTEGVLYRVQQLAQKYPMDTLEEKYNNQKLRWYTDRTRNHPPYVKLVPLLEVVAEGLESTVLSQKVKALYETLIGTLGTELDILLKIPKEQIEKVAGEKITHGIIKVRQGTIAIDPGYDGEYGKVAIWGKDEEKKQTLEQVDLGI